ncbi:UbiA family prenyltransferase [Candidatus Woesearchaeota archaeon]|nr:UbiA family prenyltransferase [Candidatus Woesearchaeota archaeon]
MLSKLSSFVDRVENAKGSLSQYFFGLLAVIMMRILLEVFLQSDWDVLMKEENLAFTIIHLYLFYFAALIFLVILLFLLTREDPVRILRLSSLSLVFVLLAPLLGFFLDWGERMKYIFSSEGLLSKFLTFCPGVVTDGLRIEVLIICLACSAYVFLKTKSFFKSALGFLLAYSFIFLLAILPLILGLFGIGYSESGFAFFFAIMTLLGLTCFSFIHDRRRLGVLLSNLRFSRVIHYSLMLLLGSYIAYVQSADADTFILVCSLLALFFSWEFAVVTNDLEDVVCDKISNPKRPLASGALSAYEMKLFGYVCLLFSLIFAALASPMILLLILFLHAVAYFYSVRPFRMKRFLFLTNISIGLASLAAVFIGYSTVFGRGFSLFPPRIALFILVSLSLGAYIKDIKDYMGDKKDEVFSIMVLLGEVKGKIVTAILVSLAYLFPLLLFRVSDAIIISLASVSVMATFLLILRKRYDEKPIFFIYYLFLICFIFLGGLGIVLS